MTVVASLLLFISITFSQNNILPDWVKAEFDQLTENQGIWRCENDMYKNANEPYDAYALKWQYDFGKVALTGEMVAIKDEKVLGKIWQFYMYWDPKNKLLMRTQFGSDGTTGIGSSLTESNRFSQHFFPSEGSDYEVGHESNFDDSGHHTTSFNIKNGKWEKSRYYLWKNVDAYIAGKDKTDEN